MLRKHQRHFTGGDSYRDRMCVPSQAGKDNSSKHSSHLGMFLKFHTLAVLSRLVWGNQETIRTISRRAMTARPSARILELAKPKKDFGKNLCRSVMW